MHPGTVNRDLEVTSNLLDKRGGIILTQAHNGVFTRMAILEAVLGVIMSNIKTIPAFIDMHVHFREPGFEQKETLETGMVAAIKGGYGTVCIMPNTMPVADNPDIIRFLAEKHPKILILMFILLQR